MLEHSGSTNGVATIAPYRALEDILREISTETHVPEEALAHPDLAEPTEHHELTVDQMRDRQAYYHVLGPIKAYLDDPLVQNVHVNPDGKIFVERFGTGTTREAPMSLTARETLISYLANQQFGRSMDYLHSRLQCDLPVYGSRVQAFAPPVMNWALTIRQHAKKVIPVQAYLDKKILSPNHARYLRQAIAEELNIGVAGAVNAGKTTFLNALLDEKARQFPYQRVLVIQDRLEVRIDGFENWFSILTRIEQAHNESNNSVTRYMYEFDHALEDGLRCGQDFIAWGEVRDPKSAYGLTMACNSGTRGLMTTIHAESAHLVPRRIEQLFVADGKVPVRQMIANVFQVVPFLRRELDGTRRVTDLVRIHGVNAQNEYEVEIIPALWDEAA